MEGSTNTAKLRLGLSALLQRYGTALVLLLLAIVFTSQNSRFLSLRNLGYILTDVSICGIVAVGMTFVIISGGVDLAVGSVLGFAAMGAAWLIKLSGLDLQPSWLFALCTAVGLGAVAGFIHGKITTGLKVPPFITTLGGLSAWRGATLLINHGGPVHDFDEGYRWWGNGSVLGLPVPVLIFIVVASVGWVVQRYTRYGRHIYAVGGNVEAARLSGLNVQALTNSVYVIVGTLAGLAGFLLSARLGSSEATAGTGYELRVIASVVIGGASLSGGTGGVGGTIIGALLIGVLSNGLVMVGVNSYYQEIVIGLIIVLAVALDSFARRRG
jgi:inositol transport system permease protein